MSKKKETKLIKYIKFPLKMVVKARDLYIRGMNQLSSHDFPGNGIAFGIPMVHHISALPRSFSASHAQISMRDKDHRVAELVRSASARNTNMTVDTTRRGLAKFRKAKSLRSFGGHDHGNRFEKIDETSPLISCGNDKKMLQRSKTYNVVKQIGSSEFRFKNI